MIKKFLSLLFILLISSLNVFAVVVVQQSADVKSPTEEAVTNILTYIIIALMGLFIFSLFIILIAWIIWKITQYIQNLNKATYDFFYKIFEDYNQQAHINRDMRFKKRNWKLLWLFWKREPVYINAIGHKTIEAIGFYNGECHIKENYYIIGIYNKVGFLKYQEQLLIIPNELKQYVMKPTFNKKEVFLINCEGVDIMANTDYFLMMLIPDYKNDKNYLDYSDDIYKNFLEQNTYRDIIKENLQQYRDGIIKSVETNPNVHFNRRNPQEKN